MKTENYGLLPRNWKPFFESQRDSSVAYEDALIFWEGREEKVEYHF